MPTPTTKTQADLVAGQGAIVQSQSTGLVDLAPGAILLAVIEAVAGVALWLQGLVLTLLAVTRAATSTGVDLDSFYADFGFVRLAAMISAGSVTFSRFSTTGSANIPAGQTIQTLDGSQSFVVIADTLNSAWNVGLNAYVMAPTVGSVTVKAQSVKAASAANALAGSITVITGSLPGVDTVNNAMAFSGGADAESDAAFRTRFRGYLAALGKGTVAAIKYVVSSLQVGLFVQVLENVNFAGASTPGFLTIVVDDGTGAPPGSLLTAAGLQVDATRAAGATFGVYAPTVLTAAVAMTVTVATGYTKATVATLIQNAITAYINALSFAGTLPYTKLAQIAYEASAGVLNVSAVTLNSATADLTATATQVIRAGAITVTTP